MATKKVKINSVEYEAKQISVPLADGSGSATFVETSDADAVADEVLGGAIFYVNGERREGSMPDKGAGGGTISTKDGSVSIPEGYYNGQGSVKISDTEKQKIIASNIRKNVSILGVTGNMDPQEGVVEQAKTVTPTKSQQTVSPDSGYTHLSQVTVEAIPAAYITTTDANATADKIAKNATAYVNGKKITGTHTDPTFTLANGVLTIA